MHRFRADKNYKPASVHHAVNWDISQTRDRRMPNLSLTPCFSWVWQRREATNRFNGLLPTIETVETVTTRSGPACTQLKQGVNEKTPAGAEKRAKYHG